ncbi:HAD family hydrolase [Phytohabitans rumicis]|uniref:Haloacid dehalogenase n=1 Tax=Phytohabitans rumicis TaxID=1076125 RepID=A0A6V8LH88_9ACTN|nr:HAD family hydrolase [Phytohabitans rumicis]GFJ96592.1 hypothetical protein Prum_102340 [Phytohabitans rumicis]
MPGTRHSHVLFDFFGTLVAYNASRVEQGYARSHALLVRWGADLSYPDFLGAWSRTTDQFDRLSDRDDHEFSMTEVGTVFLAGVLGRAPAPTEVETFVVEYVDEWNTGVTYQDGVAACVRDLARDHRLAVVSNTHQSDLVPNHLRAMGLWSSFDAVVTSVDVGWRKPHPKIYAVALDALGIDAGDAVFVGDSFEPDFAGPERAGMTAFLIDPDRRAPVPGDRRLDSVVDLPARLRAQAAGSAGA